ncbi:MAG: glycosyltransferase [Elusimicrobia bacterium]|nr:glycosyltransferase [Elusimicrobiota bacterium]
MQVSESNEWSGGAAQLLALSQGLSQRGWRVLIACRPGSGLERRAGELGFRTFAVGLKEDYDIFSAWTLARFIKSERVDVVHAHHNRSHAVCLLSSALLRLMGERPVLIVSRRVSFPPGQNPFSRWKYQSRLIDQIVAVAEAVKGILVDSGVDPSRVSVIRSGVDSARFRPREPDAGIKKAFGLRDGMAVIGKIANASEWKGQEVLLRAAALLKTRGRQGRFIFAGRDTDGALMRQRVKELGLEDRVVLAGFRSDIPELLSTLTLSVNAAVKGEGLSGALRESLCQGIPVIASDVAGNRELLGPGSADFLFPPGDAAALAARLEWALDHQEQVRAWAQRWRRERLSEFDSQTAITRTEALYRRMMVPGPTA